MTDGKFLNDLGFMTKDSNLKTHPKKSSRGNMKILFLCQKERY